MIHTNRDTDGSVDIILNFGWAGLPGRLILFSVELKAADRGTFCQRRAEMTESAVVSCICFNGIAQLCIYGQKTFKYEAVPSDSLY